MRIRLALLGLAALAAVLPVHGQETKDSGLYRLEINFRDGSEAGAMTDRRYTLLVTDSERTIFKVGSRSPTVSGTVPSQTAGSAAATQFTYLDIGVNIDCVVQKAGARVLLNGSVDLSNVGPSDGPSVGGIRNPTIRQASLRMHATMDYGKPTVVAAIDDPVTARKLQVEATITKAN